MMVNKTILFRNFDINSIRIKKYQRNEQSIRMWRTQRENSFIGFRLTFKSEFHGAR
jgi:hypothetical protein